MDPDEQRTKDAHSAERRVTVPVAAVIVHHRRPDLLGAALDALYAQSVRPRDVVVVDNGDGTAAPIVSEFGARLLQLDSNSGYAAAVNAGLATVDPDLHPLVMTHDCVLRADALERMVERLLSDSSIGVVGPLLGRLDERGHVWSAGGGFGRIRRLPFHRDAGLPLQELEGPDAVEVEWLDGACLLIRRSAFDSAGPFDESWFLYVEEVEWLQRARRKGWRVVCDHRAVAWQRPGMTPPYLEARNLLRWLISRRHYFAASIFVGRQLRLAAAAGCAGRAWELRARALGLADGVGGRFNPHYVSVRS
ncbi:MAG TPA: glycosyltransferase family 2 protein [Mycobacteriales bacterium]|nr:glycosyltransferase family 2 protein [Mycobacteriales bacterium]